MYKVYSVQCIVDIEVYSELWAENIDYITFQVYSVDNYWSGFTLQCDVYSELWLTMYKVYSVQCIVDIEVYSALWAENIDYITFQVYSVDNYWSGFTLHCISFQVYSVDIY